ncbi:MAG TPA: flagellar hook-basal body complex protein FliE [Syntrophobacteraceae bacterium]|nr:flagellar hook-basal body complex protein FliE [Syntrophobacteraceae bacterium]
MRIDSVVAESLRQDPSLVKGGAQAPGPSFGEQLKAKLLEADQLQQEADKAMMDGAAKGAVNIHETMIKLEEADISLRMLVKFRNKALEAYHEVMRMQF